MRVSRLPSRPRGFTLIEIMIVIALISLLMLIALPSLVRSKYQAQWSSCVQNESNIASALETYNAQEKSYPTQVSAIVAGGYIRNLPTCPSNGTNYGYVTFNTQGAGVGTTDSYSIYCNGSHHEVLDGILEHFPQYNPEIGARQKGH